MRALVQRVKSAWVRVSEREVARIELGLLALVGFAHGDGPAELRWMARKICGLRIFADEAGRMSRDLREVGGAVLVVPQFTLYGDVKKGFRPDFSRSLDKVAAAQRFLEFVDYLHQEAIPVATGEFGAEMEVGLVNDGPVTIWLEKEGSHAS
ncbi:MAG: D-tyrosyl-tRNA(Tyr) deacylase [Firmicutes bacterium]|nr:D-tyrosyl-tRNA(Tyr) deacylase [Bacillota bacterium]